jgi:hypothetical protein
MHMQMKNDLPPFFVAIYHGAESPLINALNTGYLLRSSNQGTGCVHTFRLNVQKGRDMPFGNNNDVYGRHGVYIIKGHDVIILIHFAARYCTIYNFTKNTVVAHGDLPSGDESLHLIGGVVRNMIS